MDVKQAIETRRARRILDTAPIPHEDLMELVQAMRLSPSCNNMQPWRVVAVYDEGPLRDLKAALTKGNAWAQKAPLIFAICARPDDDCRLADRRDYFLFGCGMAVGEMMLRATELGLIAHPIAGYDPLAAKKALGVPDDYILITLVNIGRPGTDASMLSEKQLAAEKERPARRPIGESFFRGKWGAPLE
jgi:nitroreductase